MKKRKEEGEGRKITIYPILHCSDVRKKRGEEGKKGEGGEEKGSTLFSSFSLARRLTREERQEGTTNPRVIRGGKERWGISSPRSTEKMRLLLPFLLPPTLHPKKEKDRENFPPHFSPISPMQKENSKKGVRPV